MGTPLKSVKLLASSKVLSPLSPLNGLFKTPISAKKSAKQLHFARSRSPPKFDLCKIVLTNFDDEVESTKEPLLINTPNKRDLLNNGLKEKKKIDILGQGAFGIVIKGKHRGENVAVKIIKNKHVRGEQNVLSLSHENLVKTIDVLSGASGNFCLILMEYLPESSELQTVIDDKNVTIDQATSLKYAIDICKGLCHCHDGGILHLDLKPSNILLCKNGVCKLCDFGNSCKIEEAHQNHHHLGTVAYSSPELLLGEVPTIKSDIFSIGIILWQLRYRITPYGDIDNNQTLIYRVVKTKLRPNSLYESTIKDKYHLLYLNCWESDPKCRPDSHEVLNILFSVLSVIL